MSTRFRVSRRNSTGPYAMAIDIGSGGTRVGVYDSSGREVGKRRTKTSHTLTSGTDGSSTIDADQIVDEVWSGIEGLALDLPEPIQAVGIDTFASSLVPVDDRGDALGPCLTYADTRPMAHAAKLSEKFDIAWLHDLTGTRLHSSYLAPRLLWLRETNPEMFSRSARFMALGEYVAHRLLGQAALGTAAAAWGGMIDRRRGTYVPELLSAVGVEESALGSPRDPSNVVTIAGTPLAQRIPALAEAVWVPVIGDGLAANLGIGARGSSTWGVSTATSGAIRVLVDSPVDELPMGLWAYRVDEQRTLVGSAMSDAGRVLTFTTSTFNLSAPLGELDTDHLLGKAPSETTPLVVPFLSGERGTNWRDHIRAVFAGVGASTTPDDFLRGSLEGVALSYLRIADQLRLIGGAPEQVVLSGGMTRAIPAWLRILADALAVPIDHIAISRSTLRGTAMLALEQLGVSDFAAAPVLSRVEPIAAHEDYYRERLERFEELANHA